jgi:hypothetical protein
MTQAEKKGLSPLAWIAIGCAGLVVIGILAVTVGGVFVARKAKDVIEDFEKNPAKAAAQAVVRFNPELEMVESDDEAGTMTVRNTRTGEVATLDFNEIAEGRFSWETAEGKVQLDVTDEEGGGLRMTTPEGEARIGGGAGAQVPDWVPRYPDTEIKGAYSSRSGEEESGAFSFETTDSPSEVLDSLQERLEDEGYEVTRQTYEAAGQEPQGSLSAERADAQRTITVVATRQGSTTTAAVTYSGRQ